MEAKGIRSSKYAPRTPAENLTVSREQRLKRDKDTASRLLDRLHWKAESLKASYIRAREIVFADIGSHGYFDGSVQSQYPFVIGISAKQAESMFKVDFFEFYTLLERFLTVSLGILGVSIAATAPRTNVNALRFITNPEFAKTRIESTHQFHANLLEALDDVKNPLHPALGSQDVRIQLEIAKEYRNRWKDADEKVSSPHKAAEEEGRRVIQLDQLELEIMLRTILNGCAHALSIVHDRPLTPSVVTRQDFEPKSYNTYDTMESGDQPIEYMDDAMDLDDW